MDIHENARLTRRGREHMVNRVLGGQTPKAAGQAVGVCPRTVKKWVDRYRAEGLAGLQDRAALVPNTCVSRRPRPRSTAPKRCAASA